MSTYVGRGVFTSVRLFECGDGTSVDQVFRKFYATDSRSLSPLSLNVVP